MTTIETTPSGSATAAPAGLEPPPGNQRFPLLDAARAIAALSVLVFHSVQFGGLDNSVGSRIGSHLNGGVAVFFVISGFLLYRPFITAREGSAPRIDSSTYAMRRLLRIFPAYWAALLILGLWPGLSGVYETDFWKQFALLKLYFPGADGEGLLVAWSLCTEISFYLVLPLYAWLASRALRGRTPTQRTYLELGALGVLAVVALPAHVVLSHSGQPALGYSLPGTFYLFAAGMGLATISVANQRSEAFAGPVGCVRRHPAALLLAAAIGLVAVSFATSASASGAVSPYYGVIAAALLLPMIFPPAGGSMTLRFLGNPVLAWLGLVSYGIYLWHVPVIDRLHSWGVSGGSIGRFALGVAVTIAVSAAIAAASYYGLERHFLRLKPGSRRR